ncbi:uncharacterized protein LOC116257536 isoform X2 [Nymphaea colorata]|uniref:uncharacterized protein LOC116257536 isoform X2 n=1 Tax=Nymphaea colorata TaxID=210225 RepID=UPI00129E86C8|nr:uncharacterized protein LOC116257536 isoform X2 [Nymphaea colorata]
MSRVTRSSRRLNEQEASSRRSSGGWKETQTTMKRLKASLLASNSSSLRRSTRVTSNKNSSVSSPSSSRKITKADIAKPPVTSTVGTKRKSRAENQDSLLPPSKRAFRPSEKQTSQKSPESKTGDRQDKNAKKPNSNSHPDTKNLEKKKAVEKPEKKQQSKSPSSLDKKKLEGKKTSKLAASLNMKKSDECKASKSPGSLSKKKPEEDKTSKLPSSLEVKTSKEGKTSKSSGKSEESNTSRGSSSRDSSEDEKQESKVHETSRSSKKRDDKAGGETAKATSGCKLGTTSKRLDARRYRQFFSSKPKEHKKEGDPGQSSHMIRDGCNETVACDEVKSANVGDGSMDHGDSYVKGDEENGNFCRLRSGKSIVKSIPVAENSLQNDSESAELEAGIDNAEGDPHPSVSEESYVLSKHCKGWVANSQEVSDFSQTPFACREQDSHTDNIFSDHELPRTDHQMALPCENGKIPSIGIMGSPEGNSLVDEAQYDDAVLSNSTGVEAKNSGERSQIVAADSHSSQTNKNLSDSHTSKGGLDAVLSPQRDSTQADLQLYDDTISLKKDFPETGHSGEKSHIAAAGLGTSQVNEKSADSCTSKEGQVVVDCDHDTSVDTKKELCTLDASKDGKTPVFLSGNKRDRCEETLESCGNGNGICGIESSKKSRLDDTPVAPEDTEWIQMNRGGDSEASTNYLLFESSKLEHPKDTECSTCGVCKLGGKLLCCDGKGCNRAYHLSCLDPPLVDTPPGTWHCLWCVKRKLEFGLHSVSKGVESIWAVRGNEISLGEGSISTQSKVEKEYLVKYRGLAHVHNRWISERQLLADAPKILAKFNSRYQKNKPSKWKSEWTGPERLLKRRLLMPPKVADEYFRNNTKLVYCNGEWLVKWKGIGYEFSTWEMENASFLTSSEAMILVKDFETRRMKAKKASDPSRTNMVHSETDMHIKMQSLSREHLPTQGLGFINKLYEYWHCHHNAIIIDDQERIAKATLFISLLVSSVSRPFLILSPSSAFSAWESEIIHVDPHIDLVVYNGSRHVREMIRGLEFYEESGCIMFQVLLSTPDAIAEDMEFLECIGWESIIIDQCHTSKMSKHFEKIRRLNTDFRLLLFNGQIKDSILEYLNIFSLLDPKDDCSGINSKKDDEDREELSVLKQRLSNHVIYEHKPDSSKFVEHWTPVSLSNAQLEQYCSILVSNSRSLYQKNDPLNPLSNILLSLKKCCDHPYLVDESLQSSLTKGLPLSEILDIGVRASGKLLLLDKILSEIKSRGLRALILFQFIGGSAPHSIGDILDDYLRQRYGADSYERIDSGLAVSKKLLALNMFNDKEKGRFVFLLENRACSQSIKLSSVDAVIIFGSDWNPSNDLKALQKTNIDFQIEHLSVFRLYIPYTLEEKILRFYAQDMVLDNKLVNLSPNFHHMLLMWGTSYLFKKFDELHDPKVQHSGSMFPDNEKLLEESFQEIVSLLPPVTNINYQPKNSSISKMKQNVFLSSKSTLLAGESRPCFSHDDQPHIYWKKLLEGRVGLRSLTGLVQRSRRKVHHSIQSSTMLAENEDHITKKKKAVDSNNPTSASPGLQTEDISGMNEGAKIVTMDLHKSVSDGSASTSCKNSCSMKEAGGEFTTHLETGSPPVIHNKDHVLETSSIDVVEAEDGRDACSTQQSLHELLRPELLTLCKALQLPKKVVEVAVLSLEYVMKNHQVPKESESILHAFLMSLCWTAASILKSDVDHEASVLLAKQQLQFKCEKAEVKSVYKKLRPFRRYLKIEILGKVVGESSKDNHVNIPDSVPHERQLELAGNTISDLEGKQCIENVDALLQGECPKGVQVGLGINHTNAFLEEGTEQEKGTSETTSLINKLKAFKKKRMKYVIDKQKEEYIEFLNFKEMKANKLSNEYAASRFHILKERDLSIRAEKLKILLQDSVDKRNSHRDRMQLYQKILTNRQRELRDREVKAYSHWVEQAKAGRSADPYLLLPLPNIQFREEDLETESQNLANEITANMSRNGNANEDVTSESLPNGPDNTPAISSGLPVAAGGASGISVTLPDTLSMLTTDSQANLKGQNTMIGSEAVKNTSIIGSADALESTKQDNQADAVMRPMKSNILTKANHVTPMESEPKSVHGKNETGIPSGIEDQNGTAAGLLQQKNGSTSQMSGRLRAELGHKQVSSVDPGERSAPAGTKSDDDNEVVEQDILPQARVSVQQPLDAASSSAVQVHVSTMDLESPTSAEMEGDTGLGSLSQDRVSPLSLNAFPSSARQVGQTCSASSDGKSAAVEIVREFDHGITGLEPFREASAPVLQPLDALPSSARHVVEPTSCMDSSQGLACAETVREHDHGLVLESPCHARGPVQQPLGTFHSGEQFQVSSANPDERSASAESARENGHAVAMSDSLPHVGVSLQQPHDDSHSSVERVADCPSVFLPAIQLLPPVGSQSIASANTRGRTIGSESGEQTLRTANPISHAPVMNYPDPLYHEIVSMYNEEEQTKKLYEDVKVRLAAERDKEIEEVKQKYAKLFQDAESRYSLTKKTLDDNMMKVMLNRSLAVAFKFLDPRAPQLVVQPGAPFQQYGNSPHGSAAHHIDPISGDRTGSSVVPPSSVGELQVPFTSLNLRPVTPVPSQPSSANPAALVYLSDDD